MVPRCCYLRKLLILEPVNTVVANEFELKEIVKKGHCKTSGTTMSIVVIIVYVPFLSWTMGPSLL